VPFLNRMPSEALSDSAVDQVRRRTVLRGTVGIGHDLLPALTAKVRHLAARRRPCRVARQPTLAGFEELLGPAAIETLGDPLPAAQLGNARLPPQAVQHNPDLLFC